MSSAHESTGTATLSSLKFDNTALRSLPVDEVENSSVRRQVRNACYSRMKPTPVDNPMLVALSQPGLDLLGVSAAKIYDTQSEEHKDAVSYFAGNKLIPGGDYAAHCYCGHQFGSFAGQLGDGAAITIGEVQHATPEGPSVELQLKGAGPTPYSRDADGRKVLRSSLREFLASEFLYHLGIPTTRAASVVTSDSRVARDPQYTGAYLRERCSIVSRLAPSFIRLGSFEIFKPQDTFTGRQGPSVGNGRLCVQMLNYVITKHYPHLWSTAESADAMDATENLLDSTKLAGLNFPEGFVGSQPDHRISLEALRRVYANLVLEITKRTAELVAEWQAVGFCHGVLNTDNLSIHGVTLDFGPYGMMDYFDNNFICNGSDHDGRYDYKSQPEICKWNMVKFAEALSFPPFPQELTGIDADENTSKLELRSVLPLKNVASQIESTFEEAYAEHTYSIWSAKLGVDVMSALALPPAGTEVVENMEKVASSSTLRDEIKASTSTDRDRAKLRFKALIGELFYVLHETYADMTLALRTLSETHSLLHMRLAQLVDAQGTKDLGDALKRLQTVLPVTHSDGTTYVKATSLKDLACFDVDKTDSKTQDTAETGEASSTESTAAAAAPTSQGSEDTAFDPVLEQLLSFCSDAEHYNQRRKAMAPHESLGDLLRMRAALGELALKRPNLRAMIANDLEAITRKLDAHSLYASGSDVTQAEKTERDRALWQRWLRSYRCVLQAEEARLIQQQHTTVDPNLESRVRARNSGLSRVVAPLPTEAATEDETNIKLEMLGLASPATKADQSDEAVWQSMYAVQKALVEAVGDAGEHMESDQVKYWRQVLRAISKKRHQLQRASNPQFILRNFIAQEAIRAAEDGDYLEVRALLRVLEDPYDLAPGSELEGGFKGLTPVNPDDEAIVNAKAYLIREKLKQLPPHWAKELCVTCSS